MMRVECRDLSAHGDGLPILERVDLSFEAPALVGILGPNGAGKSTLLRLLAGYRQPDAGAVLWDGKPVSTWTAAARGAACGYCPQRFEPAWDYSVAEIVSLGRDRNPDQASTLGDILAEHGLSALADGRWSRLSGGERARVMLAATLVTRPLLVLADEPGASLDMRHRLALMQRLKLYARNALVIVVMHDLDLALRFCDRLVLLDAGKVAADRPSQAMLADPAFEAAFQLRLQAHPRQADRDWVLGIG